MKKFLRFIPLLIVFLAVAAYTGPGARTVSQTVVTGDQYGAECQNADGWRYVVLETFSCDTPASLINASYPDPYAACGPSTNGRRVYGTTCSTSTVTTTYAPATVSGSVNCARPGNAGWCTGNATLNLSANEPMPGQIITGIESDNYGWLCTTSSSSPTCAWNFPEGNDALNFWAKSSNGDTSYLASASAKVDRTAPIQMVFASTSPDGANGWYHSAVSVNASAFDSISGLAQIHFALDGGAWANTVPVVATDGNHVILVRSTDIAGNTTSPAMLSIPFDATPPTVSLALPVAGGSNGWYGAPVALAANASDAVSGVARVEYSIDGGTWTSNPPVLTDGTHTIQIRATDAAGNAALSSRTLNVDTTPPVLAVAASPGTTGAGGWYTSEITLSINATDATSGLALIEYSLDGSTWTNSNSLALSDGTHTVQTRATDWAGNQTMHSETYQIDTLPPTGTTTLAGTSGAVGWYTSDVSVTMTASDSGSGLAIIEYQVDGGTWQVGDNVTLATDGSRAVDFRITDNAGNVLTQAQQVNVDKTAPLSMLASLATSQPTVGDTLIISGTSSETGSGLAYVEISFDGGLTWQRTALSGNSWSYTKTFEAEGSYQVMVRAADLAGNVEVPTAVTTITVQPKPEVMQAVLDLFVPQHTVTLIATITSTPMPSPTATAMAPAVTAEPSVQSPTITVVPVAITTSKPAQPSPIDLLSTIPAVIALASVLAYGSTNGGDPRPPVASHLAKTIDLIRTLNKK